MKKKLFYLTRLCFIATFIFLPRFINAQSQTWNPDELRKKVETRLAAVEGDFAIAFKDLQTGHTFFLHEKEIFHAASTMKVPVMIEVFRQAEKGKFSLQDSVLVKNEFASLADGSPFSLSITDDSADGMYQRIGKKMTVYDLVFQMITVSSNLATNILIEKVKAEKVMKTMRKLGAADIRVLRGVEDQKAYDKGLLNTVTAYDLMLLLEKIETGKAAKKQSCQQMTDILLAQKFNEIIPAKLPAGVKVAHKTGNIKGVQHDAALVYLPDGRKYVLTLLSKNLKNEPAGVQALSDISAMFFKVVN